jgi:xanthine/uracil permease
MVFVIAACVAILLGFSPVFGALVLSIPQPVLGGMAIVLFGLIATTGIRICVENKVDFTDNKNFITMAVALTLGAGNLAITQGDFSIGGIGTACIGALVIYQILNKFGMGKKEEAPAAS